ncbi:MAG: regulatory protein TetR, partial [Nocardioidaceae bacterium]|nr:regulatory protein TetR [Nocardioidaceae bacterium]
VAGITRGGKALHRTWVEEVFAPFLPDDAAAREESLDLLVVACDVTTWKLLRLDRELSRPHTQARMERLVRAVLTTTTTGFGPAQEG